jgi:hypothetical protein
MFRKILIISTAMIIMINLSACTGMQLSLAAVNPLQNPSGLQVKDKLAVGILKLEDSTLAVTAAQARDLLFMWKGIKSLNTNNNTSPLEIAAIYDQMQETLTPQQVQSIRDMNITDGDIGMLMQKYGIVSTNPVVGANTKKTSTSSNRGGPGGDPMMGPPPGGDMMGGPMGGAGTNSNAKTSSTTKSSSAPNYNLVFIDAVIQVLKHKTGNS